MKYLPSKKLINEMKKFPEINLPDIARDSIEKKITQLTFLKVTHK